MREASQFHMQMRAFFFFSFLFILCSCSNQPEKVTYFNSPELPSFAIRDTIARDSGSVLYRIRHSMTVSDAHVGAAGMTPQIYEDYLWLKESATPAQLYNYCGDTSVVLACYAAWALAEKRDTHLVGIFEKFAANKRTANVLHGCIQMSCLISDELYMRYMNSLPQSEIAADRMLKEMDSLIIFEKFKSRNMDQSNLLNFITDGSLNLSRALTSRKYPDSYTKKIAEHAFIRNSQAASDYLAKYYPEEYKLQIRAARIKLFKQGRCDAYDLNGFYSRIEELLSYRDEKINIIIIKKLEEDTCWRSNKEYFIALLRKYDIDHRKAGLHAG